ncbi:MAG: nucleotidyltransferase family protein [Deltaproteobacteria bacterium]|nr:nucleotidyltransferase family protein [Deltaproteobacteria bacterium]
MNSHFPQKAMLLAAGLGERLRPLTLTTPKPLIEVGEKSLIEYNLDLLKKFGIGEVVINLFHLGEQIEAQLGNGLKFDFKISYSKEKILMGTGGGLKQAEQYFDSTFVMLNADVLIDADLKALFELHQRHNALATLLVSGVEREDVKRKVYLDDDGKIVAISELDPSHSPLPQGERGRIFTGLQILEPEIFSYLPANHVCSIIDEAYLPALAQGKTLAGLTHPGYFHDVGSFDRLEEVRRIF